MDISSAIIYIVILILSVVIHEMAHGYTAYWLGDPTAKLQGRLTLNPIKHLDWFGSVVVPGILILLQSPFLIGWAKPVPFNPYNFKKFRRWGAALVAVMGPISNILLALLMIAIGKILVMFVPNPGAVLEIVSMAVVVNIALALFNMLPVPPLDGHHILFALLPPEQEELKRKLYRWSPVLFLVVFFVVWPQISRLILVISDALWGIFF